MERKIQFIVTGFRQNMQFRMFTFERIAEDYSRSAYTVNTDTALIRKHGISVQELPLLCLRLLERAEGQRRCLGQRSEENQRTVTFTEEDMVSYIKDQESVRQISKQKRRLGSRNLFRSKTLPADSNQ